MSRIKETKDGKKAVSASTRNEWRQWLEQFHNREEAVWLILFNKKSGITSVTYDEAVEEALCFGWIDSKAKRRDDQSRYQYFSRRKGNSPWSRSNRERVDRLIQAGLMTPAGQAAIDAAKTAGRWLTPGETPGGDKPDETQG